MIRLIINADDFGISHQVNEAIIRAYTEGIVTSTTLLVNGEAFAEAIQIAKDNNLNVGIHLNLTEGKPITTEYEKISSLIDSNGNFVSEFRSKCLELKLSYKHIYHELENQISLFLSTGLVPSHIDSHHHVHTLPLVISALKKLGTKYQIQKIRKSRNLFWPSSNFIHKVIKGFYKKTFNAYLAHHFVTSDYFFGPDFFLGGDLRNIFSLHGLEKAFSTNGTYEFMCHPSLSGQGKKELDVLTDRKVKEMLIDSGIKLISFNEL